MCYDKKEVIILILPVLYSVLAVVSTAAAVYCLVLYFKRRRRKDLVCDNSSFLLMNFTALILDATILYLLSVGEWQLCMVPAVACVLCLLGLVSWHNEIIVFDEEGFTRRDLLFRTRRHSYTDFTDCSERILKQTRKRKEVQTLFYIGEKRFSLARKAANYGEFAKRIRKYGRDGLDP